MITTLLMTLEGAEPEVTRCVNVDDSLHLGVLSQVVDAAFGFSGAASHLWATGDGPTRRVYSESPGAGEGDEAELTVADLSAGTTITYIYDPAANWNIHIALLGHSRLDGPTPLLVDASGPDIVEAANGPAMMTKFRAEARRVCAGLDPDMEVTPLLLSFLPVMSPERMLQRLTVADPVTVANRIGFVAEELLFDLDQVEQIDEIDAAGGSLAADFEEFLDSRPDIREIMERDPAPDRNPTLIAAVAEFFEEKLGEPAEDRFAETLRALVACFAPPVELSAGGSLPAGVACELAEALQLPLAEAQPGGQDPASVVLARRLLEGAGLVTADAGRVRITERGESFLAADDPVGEFATELLLGFETLYGRRAWKSWVRAIGSAFGPEHSAERDFYLPAGSEEAFDFLTDLGAVILDAEDEARLSPSGRVLVAEMIARYGG